MWGGRRDGAGRKPALAKEQRDEAIRLYVDGELVKVIAHKYDRHPAVIQRLVRPFKRGHVR